MRMKWLYMIISAFCWCSCETSPFQLDDEEGRYASDRIPVMIKPLLGSNLKNEVGYVPMNAARTETDPIYTEINNTYKAAIVKRIDHKWILDTIVEGLADNSQGKSSIVKIKKNTSLSPLNLELRPGDYRIVFFMGGYVVWDTDLKPGTVVEDANGKVHRALYYSISTHPMNTGYKTLNRMEFFAGIAEVQVEKTTDLHSAPPSAYTVELKRKNNCFRVILQEADNDAYPFGATQQTVNIVLVTENGSHFPGGLDVWGNPWYEDIPSDTLFLRTDCDFFNAKQDYLISKSEGPTVFSPYYFMTDEGVNCKIDDFYITGQSMENHQYFKFKEIPQRIYVLKNDYIDGLIVKPTKGVFPYIDDYDQTWEGVYLEEVYKDPATLLGLYMEWNY